MPITSFTYITIGPANNRRVVFTAVPHVGESFEYTVHTVDPAWDPEVVKVGLQAKLEDNLAENEVEAWLANTEMLANPQHAVKPRYLSTWRARYKDAIREEHRRLGYKMHREILNNTFTNPQMNSAWNMTNPERNAFLGRVELAHDAWIVLQAEVGE